MTTISGQPAARLVLNSKLYVVAVESLPAHIMATILMKIATRDRGSGRDLAEVQRSGRGLSDSIIVTPPSHDCQPSSNPARPTLPYGPWDPKTPMLVSTIFTRSGFVNDICLLIVAPGASEPVVNTLTNGNPFGDVLQENPSGDTT